MKKKRADIIIYILFLAYIAVALYVLFFAESMGRTGNSGTYGYNLKPFKEIRRYLEWSRLSEVGMRNMIMNIFGNILCFLPLGFFLPRLTTVMRNFVLVTTICFAASIAVEVIQLLSGTGCCDVDDVILNTIGGAIGYIVYSLVRKVAR